MWSPVAVSNYSPIAAAILGVGGLSPALDLDFVAMAPSRKLDPRITFSRAGLATRTGPSGNVEWAPHNLLATSESGLVGWQSDGVTIVTNLPGVPGVTSASFSLGKSVPSTNYPRTNIDVPAGQKVTCSAWLWFEAAPVNGMGVQPSFLATGGWFDAGAVLNVTTTPQFFTWTYTPPTATTGGSAWALKLLFAGGGGTLRVSGAQVNYGELHPYWPTNGATYHGPRFEYDPPDAGVQGLLARTSADEFTYPI